MQVRLPTADGTRQVETPSGHPLLRALAALFKIRVVGLLVFAAVGGLFLAAGGWPGAGPLILLVLVGGLAAAGASALNEYLERDTDALMTRTRDRPLVTGALQRVGWVPIAASLMISLAILAALALKPSMAIFVFLGVVIYLGVYTLWLKPRTSLNIVIGGAAGCAAVLSGSAAAGNWNEPGAVVLALLVLFWTPTHFWSLAIVYSDDYGRAGVPMLPTQVTPKRAAGWILVHTGATALCAIALAFHPALSWLYAVPVAGATAYLLWWNIRLVRQMGKENARRLFKISNLFLGLVILLVVLDSLI